jgi:hypothetical protein
MKITSFMKSKFDFLPAECKGEIMKKVNFKGESKFQRFSFVENVNDEYSTLYILHPPEWNKKKCSWFYTCRDLTSVDHDKIILKERDLKIKENAEVSCQGLNCYEKINVCTFKRCKVCRNCLCRECFKDSKPYGIICDCCR